jgi:DNA-binding HxlR family transcriptional regulator
MLSTVERGHRSHCPVSLALEAIGDRWSLLILRDLILRGKSRYQELLNSEEGIATNILADRLLRLEQQGLISKADDPDDKRQFRYSPTQKALDLLPVIFEMARWSAKYDPLAGTTTSPALRRFYQGMKAGKGGFIRHILAQFKLRDGRDAPPVTRRRAVRTLAGSRNTAK